MRSKKRWRKRRAAAAVMRVGAPRAVAREAAAARAEALRAMAREAAMAEAPLVAVLLAWLA